MAVNNKSEGGAKDDRGLSASERNDMAIAKNPKRNRTKRRGQQAQAFISKAESTGETPKEEQNKKPIMIRVDPEMLDRIDRAAKRLGISRSAFIVSSTAIRVETME